MQVQLRWRSLVAAMAAIAFSPQASAQCISIDFSSSAGSPTQGFQGEAMLSGGTWNSLTGGSLSYGLVDTHGASTGAVLDFSFVPFSASPVQCPAWNATDPSHPLMSDGFSIGNGLQMNVLGLEAGTYDVFVYSFSSVLGSSGLCVTTDAATPAQVLMADSLCTPSGGPFANLVTFSQQSVQIDRMDASTLNDDLRIWLDDCQPAGSGHRVMGMEIRRTAAPTLVGESYCIATMNSTGSPAYITAFATPNVACDSVASASVPANDLKLVATSVPAFQPGFFYYGPDQILVPFQNGFRCVGAGSTGTARLPNVAADANGVMSLVVDYNTPPTAATQITAGTTWNVQAWYRDPAGGGMGTNLTDGREINF